MHHVMYQDYCSAARGTSFPVSDEQSTISRNLLWHAPCLPSSQQLYNPLPALQLAFLDQALHAKEHEAHCKTLHAHHTRLDATASFNVHSTEMHPTRRTFDLLVFTWLQLGVQVHVVTEPQRQQRNPSANHCKESKSYDEGHGDHGASNTADESSLVRDLHDFHCTSLGCSGHTCLLCLPASSNKGHLRCQHSGRRTRRY